MDQQVEREGSKKVAVKLVCKLYGFSFLRLWKG